MNGSTPNGVDDCDEVLFEFPPDMLRSPICIGPCVVHLLGGIPRLGSLSVARPPFYRIIFFRFDIVCCSIRLIRLMFSQRASNAIEKPPSHPSNPLDPHSNSSWLASHEGCSKPVTPNRVGTDWNTNETNDAIG